MAGPEPLDVPASTSQQPDPTAIVADTDVLAADLLVGGIAREALDLVRSHSWLSVLASETLLAETRAVVTTLAGSDLADRWYARISEDARLVDHPDGDHPALASAYHGGAAHLLTFDERLQSPQAAVRLQQRFPISVRSPDAFVATFDVDGVHEAIFGEPYDGPDVDPRE